MPKLKPFSYFKTSPEIIRLAVILYVRFPLSLRDVEDVLHKRAIDVSHESVRSMDSSAWRTFDPGPFRSACLPDDRATAL